jgi:tetratricopeptide (TPR) repeat protein
MRRLLLLGLLLPLVSCAARAKAPARPTLADADRLAVAGCYTCLVDALKIYDGLLAQRPSAAATRGAFRTAVLLALREKEIGLAATPYLERARALANSLPAGDEAPFALDIARAIPWDYSGITKEFTEEFVKTMQAVTPQVKGWRERLAGLGNDAFFTYLDAALACSYGDWRARDQAFDAIVARQPASLLIKYRVGICVQQRRALLEDVLAAEPRYAEAHLFLGRYALVDASTGHGKRSAIAPHLDAAYAAFPKSPSVTFTLAGMSRAFNKLNDALRFYDETLALVPRHREALLGRTIALTYLQQPDAAIATATHMIELGDWYVADAYYWRAFNKHLQKHLEAAREDAERAKSLAGLRSDVYLLAGIISYDMRQLDAAAPDLAKAWQLNDTACDASWYLGLVRSEQGTWNVAAVLFPRAAACYRSDADIIRAQQGVFQQVTDTPEERAALDAEYQQSIEQQLVAEARSYYNAAYACAQLKERDRAIDYAERAGQHAVMKEKAAQLIAALKKGS